MTNKQAVIEIVLKAIDKASSVLKGVGSGLTSSLGSLGSIVSNSVGAAIGALENMAGYVAKFIASSMDVAAEFQSKMSMVNSILKRSQDEMNKLGEEAMRLGRITRFSADDAAEAMVTLASAGLDYETILHGATEAVLMLAAATKGDLRGAAQVFASVVNMFHLSGQEALDSVNALTAAANNANLSLPNLASALRAVGAQAYGMKMPLSDVTVLLGMFGRAGVAGTEAGTQLSRLLMYLSPVSKKAGEEMQRLGLITADGKNQFFDLNGQLKSGREIIETLSNAVRGMTDEQKQNTLHILFGAKAMRSANLLINEGVEGYDKLVKAMAGTSAIDMAAERMNNYKGAMDQLQDTWKTMKIAIGTGIFLPVAKDAANWANEILSALSPLTDWVYENGPVLWSKIKVKLSDWFDASGLVEVFAPIKDFIDSLAGGGGNARGVGGHMIGDLAGDAKPGLDGLERAFQETWKRIKEWVKAQMKDMFSGTDVKGSLSGLIDDAFGPGSAQKVATFADNVATIVSGLAKVAGFIADAGNFVLSGKRAWDSVGKNMAPVLNDLAALPGEILAAKWDQAKQKLADFRDGIAGWADKVMASLKPGGGPGKAGGGGKGGGFDLMKMLGLGDVDPKETLDRWASDLSQAWYGVKSKIKRAILGDDEETGDGKGPKPGLLQMLGLTDKPEIHLEQWWAGLKAWFAGLPMKIAGLFGGGKEGGGGKQGGGFSITSLLGLDGATQSLSDWAAGLPGAIGSLVTDAFTAVFGPVPEQVQTDLDAIKDKVGTTWEGIKLGTIATWESVKTNISDKWTEIKTDVAAKAEEIKTNVSTKWTEIKTNVGQTLSEMHQTLQARWDGFLREVTQKMDSILSKSKEKWESLKTDMETKLTAMGVTLGIKWGEFVQTVQTKAGEIRDKAQEKWEDMKVRAGAAWDAMKITATAKWTDIKMAISDQAQDIWVKVTTKTNQVAADVSTTWDRVKTTAESKWKDIKDAVAKKWDELVNWVKGKLSQWEDIGRGMVEGLKRGWDRFMASMREGFWTAIADLLAWLKGKLGIASPAKATMPFGTSMAEGIQVAFVDGMALARDSMVDAATDVVDAVGKAVGDADAVELLAGPSRTIRVISEGQGTGRSLEEVRDDLMGRSTGDLAPTLESLNDIITGLDTSMQEVARAIPTIGDSGSDSTGGGERSDLFRPIGAKTGFTRKGRGGMIYTSQYNYWEKWSAYHGLPIPEGVQDKGRAFSPEALEAIRAYTKKMVEEWRKALEEAARKRQSGGAIAEPGEPTPGGPVPGVPGIGGGTGPGPNFAQRPIQILQTVIVKMGQTEIARQVAESEPVAAWKADIWPVGVS